MISLYVTTARGPPGVMPLVACKILNASQENDSRPKNRMFKDVREALVDVEKHLKAGRRERRGVCHIIHANDLKSEVSIRVCKACELQICSSTLLSCTSLWFTFMIQCMVPFSRWVSLLSVYIYT